MIFKNLQIYRLRPDWHIGVPASKADLTAWLEQGQFTRCPPDQPASCGWTPPREHGDLVHEVGGHRLLAFATEQRLLPAETINRTVRELADRAAADQGHILGRKGLRELRERVTADLLPQAFTRIRRTHVWLDRKGGWLGIDASTRAGADPALAHYCRCVGGKPVTLLRPASAPSAMMAAWLAKGEGGPGFTIDRDCELRAADEKQAVRYTNQPLTDAAIADEIRAHLATGQMPARLSLTWNDRVSFTLTDSLEIRRLFFIYLSEEMSGFSGSTVEEKLDFDFSLMAHELAQFLPALLRALGGEAA
ncbi:MAG: recombination-associated protein RdgC [Azonexus sp.]|jgi:recombination associated protein RdgC|nr:recombination-associated protein RdgC [Azonexus sp.]